MSDQLNVSWSARWSWPQAVAIVAALVGGALVIQAGHPSLRAIPPAGWAGVGLVGLPLLLIGGLRLLRPRQTVLRGLGSVELALAALIALIVLAAPAAIWPQGELAPDWLRNLGLDDIFSSLPYAAALGLLLINLAAVCGQRLRTLTCREVPLLLVHAGILVALASAAAGSGSFLRGRLILSEGAPANASVIDRSDQALATLPRGILLDDFRMEEAPPRLVLADGRELTVSRDHIAATDQIDLAGFTIHIDDRIDQAAIIDGQPTRFVQPGARPAIHVTIERDGQRLGSGWLHAPSLHGEALFLDLGQHRMLLLEEPRASHFASAIRLAGDPIGTGQVLEVNLPLRLGNWWCYQAGYDELAGTASAISILDCVYDPSYPWVRAGLIIFLLGILGDLLQRRLPRPEDRS